MHKTSSARIRLAGLVEESIVDGPGLRLALFTQGCPHHCSGCHNPQTHSFEGGFWLSTAEVLARLQENPLLAGITFSGGEPFEQAQALCPVADGTHNMGLSVVTFTGYTYETLLRRHDPWIDRLLDSTDLLIDGPYVAALRDMELRFRGSSNQRELDRAARAQLRTACGV